MKYEAQLIREFFERRRVRRWLDHYVNGYNERWGYCLREPGETAAWPNQFDPMKDVEFYWLKLRTRLYKIHAEHR